MSTLALQLISENLRTQDPFLDLGNCGLTSLPNELFEISYLEELNLGVCIGNGFTKNHGENNIFIGNELKKLNKLSKLKMLLLVGAILDGDICFLEKLTALQCLDLRENQITNIRFLEKLTALQYLDLRGNQITDIRFLEKLTALQTLDLRENQITDIRFLEKLTALQTLDLSYNQITDYSFLEKLSQLQNLYLGSNQITDIRFLENLTQLQSLDLWKNQITDYSFLEKLSQLQTLNLWNNQITDYSFLEKLTQLQNLYLGSNQITDYSFLEKLSQLQTLNLWNNQITDYSFLEKLTQLQSLDLSNNQITEISLTFIRSFPRLQELKLNNNPIQNIPKEIFNKDKNVLQEVRNFLEDLEKGKDENKEIKIIFIGNGSVGKTQVAKRLAEQEKFVFDIEHNSTHAIALLRRDLAGFELNCWDFAGQDIYHATHRLFMQTRALLVLVWDFENETQDFHTWQSKQYENEKLLYWLEYAKCFAPESPILVLQNKIDTFPQSLYFEKEEEYKKEYKIIDFLKISAKSGDGFKVLERVMKKAFQEQSAFQTPPLPTSWVEVRKVIREKQETSTQKTLSIDEFTAICIENSCEKSATTILGYLHDTGVLYYCRGYFNDQIILNQDWAIQATYKILNRESDYFEILQHEKGKLDYELISEIWASNTDDERKLFIDFMLSAELAFETTEEGKYEFKDLTFVIPQLLPLEKPNDIKSWEQKNAQHLQKTEISYRFLPKVFIQRFIVKANRFSEVRLMWQKGLLLKTAQGSAVVEACYEKEAQKITILSENELITQKIKEELSAIDNEGKLKSKEGQSENLSEKFGLEGLNPANREIQASSLLQNILSLIDEAETAKVFEELDKANIENYSLSQLKKEFISGKVGFDFYDRLKMAMRDTLK